MELFESSRDEAILAAEWRAQTVHYIEAWKYKNVNKATAQNLRHGVLDDSQIEEWLHHKSPFSIPEPPASAGDIDGGIRLLFCERHPYQQSPLSISKESFLLVESEFDLHPATISAVSVLGGSYSRHIQYDEENSKIDKISVVLKAPQKFEIANYMLSLTHDTNTNWTLAILVGEFVTDQSSTRDVPWPSENVPFQTFLKGIGEAVCLWNHPLLLPCILIRDHMHKARTFCDGRLTYEVMRIEDELGTTRVGRRQHGTLASQKERPAYVLAEERFSKGAPVEKSQAMVLTVRINTQFTKVLFTKESPMWNFETSKFLQSLLQEDLSGFNRAQGHKLRELIEYNIPIAKSVENHVIGLQTRLELQLSVLYSFIAQTDNQISARLAATSGRDSVSMKILAFITTLYLPGTFIATLFSMTMFNWQNDGSSGESTVSNHFWIYWAVSAPLTALTFLGFGLWWRVERNRFNVDVKHEMVNSELFWERNLPKTWRHRITDEQDKTELA